MEYFCLIMTRIFRNAGFLFLKPNFSLGPLLLLEKQALHGRVLVHTTQAHLSGQSRPEQRDRHDCWAQQAGELAALRGAVPDRGGAPRRRQMGAVQRGHGRPVPRAVRPGELAPYHRCAGRPPAAQRHPPPQQGAGGCIFMYDFPYTLCRNTAFFITMHKTVQR